MIYTLLQWVATDVSFDLQTFYPHCVTTRCFLLCLCVAVNSFVCAAAPAVPLSISISCALLVCMCTTSTIRKTLRKVSNLKHKNPDSQELRLSYCETLKQYKITLRTKKEQYLQNHLQLIEESLGSNQSWKIWTYLPRNCTTNSPFKMEIYGKIILKITIENSQSWYSEKLKDLERVIKMMKPPWITLSQN